MGNGILLLAACVAVAAYYGLAGTLARQGRDALFDSPEEREAYRLMVQGMDVIAKAREAAGYPLDSGADPNRTGLIGVEWSGITTTLGDLHAKRTATNPVWAGVLVRWMREAGVRPGSTVWATFSGSFPGLNLAVLVAAEALQARVVAVSSLGASMWGANLPGFSWAAMEHALREAGIVSSGTVAVTLGGSVDRGEGMPAGDVELLQDAARKAGWPLLRPADLAEAVSLRLMVLEEAGGGRQPALYVNVGGGHASLGGCPDSAKWPPGLSREPRPCPGGVPGMLHVMSNRNVPVLHLLNIKELALSAGIPIDAVFRRDEAPIGPR